MSNLGKTRRRIVDISGGFPGMISDRSDQFLKFLETNSEDTYTRPWHRLERGMRLNRLRRFVDDEALRFQLGEEEFCVTIKQSIVSSTVYCFCCKYASKDHSNDTTQSVAREYIKCVIKT